jgi:phosphoglycolate phosphatase-like HAD superfamily hydrolase
MAREMIGIHNGLTRLVLWDVDHTLIETRGVGRELFGEAFRSATGEKMAVMAEMAGRTEPTIVRETLQLHGLDPTADVLETFFDALALGYEENVAALTSRGRVLPGAREALASLAARDDVVTSVLTGNLRRVAVTKLAAFELDQLVDFDAGAYGSDDADRANLVRVARERVSAKYGVEVAAHATTVVGDTPNDIVAGLRAGAHVVGVASGKNSADELADAGAEVVLPDLGDLDEVLRSLSLLHSTDEN